MGNEQSSSRDDIDIKYDVIDSIPNKELGNLAYALQIKNPRKLSGPNRKKVVNCILDILNNDGQITNAGQCLEDFQGEYEGKLDIEKLRQGRKSRSEKCSNKTNTRDQDILFFSHRQFVLLKDGPNSTWCIDRSEELEDVLRNGKNPYNGKSLTEKELKYLRSQRSKKGIRNIPYFDSVSIERDKYEKCRLASIPKSPSVKSLQKSPSQISVKFVDQHESRYPIEKYLKELKRYDENKYENIVEIGEGSFATAYRANRKKDGKQIVIKKMSKILEDEMKNTMMIGPLPKEYVIMRGLNHPNILKVYGLQEDDGNFYMITDYYDGGDLQSYIDVHNDVELDVAINIMRHILDALEYCHDRNICHRDIKLENILATKDLSKIVLADFGFATIQEPTDSLLDDYPGSPVYAAPELMQGIPYRGNKADIWAVGVCLYTLITAEYPFWSDNRREMFNQIVKSDPFEDMKKNNRQLYDRLAHTPCMKLASLLLTKNYSLRPTVSEIKQSECFSNK